MSGEIGTLICKLKRNEENYNIIGRLLTVSQKCEYLYWRTKRKQCETLWFDDVYK